MSQTNVQIPAAGRVFVKITAGLQAIRYRADYRLSLPGGQQSEWILIDYFNGGEGEDENNYWPIADSSILNGSDICVQCLIARVSGGGHPYDVSVELLHEEAGQLGILEFQGQVDQDAIPLVAWFNLESGQ